MAELDSLLEQGRKELKERNVKAWAACIQLTAGENPEHAMELAQKAMELDEAHQDTLRKIGREVFLNGCDDA